jgi:hypothetical protein
MPAPSGSGTAPAGWAGAMPYIVMLVLLSILGLIATCALV